MPKSYKHKDKRALIPSKEEEGYELANPIVKEKQMAEYPKNPIVHRGQDPELMWMNKYGNDDTDDVLQIDIRSLYRHEHILPEALLERLYQLKKEENAASQMDLFASFGNEYDIDELDKVGEYYQHQNDWKNRLILGDSQLVMNSLLEREGMAGKVQMIYIDPPYGIKYKSNWQVKMNSRTVEDKKDEHLSGEPEMIKAYRDTWELGIHSYLSYLRDRLLVAKALLTESGSCFVQISDENVHLIRSLMDEVFGSENFVVSIIFQKKAYQDAVTLASVNDYILWYAMDKSNLKTRSLFIQNQFDGEVGKYRKLVSNQGEEISSSLSEKEIFNKLKEGWRLMRDDYPLVSQDPPKEPQPFEFDGKTYEPTPGRHWSVNYPEGLTRLVELGRIRATENRLYAKVYWDDNPLVPLNNIWTKMKGAADLKYVVQTSEKPIQRCILMATDPGDLILDPTCGSGTTAYVAEQWGRRWITIDTSRIALNIAKTRLMTGVFPYYELYDQMGEDIRQGFIYKTVPHITLKSLANDESPANKNLYDHPKEDKKKLRVAGPFTVETLQNFNPVAPEEIDDILNQDENFEAKVFEHLKTAGIKTGKKEERATFTRIDTLNSEYLHAEGYYRGDADEEKKAYLHIGPKFGTVSKSYVNAAVKECRSRGDADWLVIMGFSFESDIKGDVKRAKMGSFEVSVVRMHDDLLQEGLKKKPAKSAASFVTIGEPDIQLNKNYQVEIKGLDIYDPIQDQVKARNLHEIAYWMVDDDYDGSNFMVRQIFFCGGKKDEFKKWKKGIDQMTKQSAKKKLQNTLKIELDDEAFDRLYGHISHPIEYRNGRKVAVRVISQFGEESMKVLSM